MVKIMSKIFEVLFCSKDYVYMNEAIARIYSKRYPEIVSVTKAKLPNFLGRLFLNLAKIFSGSTNIPTVTFGNVILTNPIHVAALDKMTCHEFTHVRQYNRVGVLGFVIMYIIDYVGNIFKYKSLKEAYLNIEFEVEARMHENDYLISF